MKDKTILIRARVKSQQESLLTVQLEDGFGNVEAVVHTAAALPDQQPAAAE